MRKLVGWTSMAALVVGGISPAMARGYDGWGAGPRGGWGHHRHHEGNDGFGTFLGVAALVGVVAILASSSAKNAKARDKTETAPPETGEYRGYDSPRGDFVLSQEDEAINACAEAVREKAADGGYAEILSIDPARRLRDGWRIEGRVEQRDSFRDTGGEIQRFSCTVRDGQVEDIALSPDLD